MTGKLRVVGPDDKPLPVPPRTMVEATERTRRELLVRSRLQIATVLDSGVPAHALARLITEMDRLDAEIRRIDTLKKEQDEEMAGPIPDEPLDEAWI